MTSSNQERENSQRESSPASTNQSSEKHSDYVPPPTTTNYPTYPPLHQMYYPNPHYPQYQSGYPIGYPSPGPGPGGYHYPQPAPYYGPPPVYQTSSAASRFYRSFIICSCAILMCVFLTSLALALVLRPQLPSYKVVSLSVTNFNTTPTTLDGQWNAKITAENPNDKLMAYFSDIKVNVVYKDGVVAVSRAPSFVLSTKDKMDMDVKGLSNSGNGDILEKTTMDDLIKERDTTGSINFALRMSSINMFKSGSFSTRSEEIVGICEGLKVVFQDRNATTGIFDSRGKPIECQLYV